MSELPLYTSAGDPAGQMEFPDALLVQGRGDQAVHETVLALRAAARRGTASTKTRGEVRGGGRKPFRQKGTGRARAGSTRSPLWKGGGVTFGPRPRSYRMRVPVSTARLALRRTFSDRVVGGRVKVIEAFDLPEVKTRILAALLKKIGYGGRLLILCDGVDRNVLRAGGNLPTVGVRRAQDVHAYDLLNCGTVLLTSAAVDVMKKRMTK